MEGVSRRVMSGITEGRVALDLSYEEFALLHDLVRREMFWEQRTSIPRPDGRAVLVRGLVGDFHGIDMEARAKRNDVKGDRGEWMV